MSIFSIVCFQLLTCSIYFTRVGSTNFFIPSLSLALAIVCLISSIDIFFFIGLGGSGFFSSTTSTLTGAGSTT